MARYLATFRWLRKINPKFIHICALGFHSWMWYFTAFLSYCNMFVQNHFEILAYRLKHVSLSTAPIAKLIVNNYIELSRMLSIFLHNMYQLWTLLLISPPLELNSTKGRKMIISQANNKSITSLLKQSLRVFYIWNFKPSQFSLFTLYATFPNCAILNVFQHSLCISNQLSVMRNSPLAMFNNFSKCITLDL